MENRPNEIRVLIVDDEKDIRDASERILTKMGFEVVKASRGDEAIQILPEKQVSPDCRLSGFQAAAEAA